MIKKQRRIIESVEPPLVTDLWLDISGDHAILKKWNGHEWFPVVYSIDSLDSNSTILPLSANQGKKLNENKLDAPEQAGTAGQVLQLDADGNPIWVDSTTVGPEIVDNLNSSSSTKVLSARMGKELNETKQNAPREAGVPGQVFQLDENGDPAWVDAAEGGTYDAAMSNASTNAPQNKVVKKYTDDNFAKKDGYYSTLTAGAAENLVGDSIAVTSGYTEKPLAIGPNGEVNEVADGRIVMNEVRGRALAWHQLANIGSSRTIEMNGITWVVDADKGTVTAKAGGTASPDTSLFTVYSKFLIKEHKYLVAGCPDNGSNTTYRMRFANGGVSELGGGNVFTASSSVGGLSVQILSGYEVTSDLVFKPRLFDLTLMFGSGNEPSTVAQAEAMIASRMRLRPYFPYNAGTLLGARLLGWSMQRTANLLNPTTKKARLVAYTNPGNTDNQYTVTNFDQLTGAALQFTPDETGVAEAVTLDADNHFVISGPGTLEIVASGQDPIGGNIAQVCVKMTWDGSKDDLVVAFEEYETNPDSANIYYDDNGTKKQVFENGIMKAASASVFEKLYFDSVSKKWGAHLPVGNVDLGTLDYEEGFSNTSRQGWATIIEDVKTVAMNVVFNAISPQFIAVSQNKTWVPGDMSNVSGTQNSVAFIVAPSKYVDASAFKTAMSGVPFWYERATPVTLTNLYYKVGNDYVPMEQVFPDGFIGYGCNWATETLVQQDPDANGHPTSITPETVENFTSDLKEAIKTLIDAQGDNVDLTLLRSNLVAMCDALKQGGVVADYTISENPTSGVFSFSFIPNE